MAVNAGKKLDTEVLKLFILRHRFTVNFYFLCLSIFEIFLQKACIAVNNKNKVLVASCLAFYCCDRQHDQKHPGKNLFHLSRYCPSLKKTNPWTQGRSLKWKPRRTWQLLCASGFLSCLLKQLGPSCLGLTALTVGWAFQYQLEIKKMPPETCPQPNPIKPILQLWFPLPK